MVTVWNVPTSLKKYNANFFQSKFVFWRGVIQGARGKVDIGIFDSHSKISVLKNLFSVEKWLETAKKTKNCVVQKFLIFKCSFLNF